MSRSDFSREPAKPTPNNVNIRQARVDDINTLCELEQRCFASDRLSKRSFKHHVQSEHSVLLLAECNDDHGSPQLLGYGLCLLNRGTRLARLYSLAVAAEARGQSIGKKLISRLEQTAAHQGRLYMRLEVAKSNRTAIALYEACGYRRFGEYINYYQDHSDADRMQKTIRQGSDASRCLSAVWYPQTTEFTCGPAALMMAMASLNQALQCTQTLELALWRESTTVFMTSGLGGTHPFGLGLAANRRGFCSHVFVNTDQPLFIDGVRSDTKKQVMRLVHNEFLNQCEQQGVEVHYTEVTQALIDEWLAREVAVVMLISTYRLDGKKAPHWVLITGSDEQCFYVHDPDVDEKYQRPIDCQHIPIARTDFDKMSSFGGNRLRTAITLSLHCPAELPFTECCT
ncbi:GNAT family N-acetyltransferase/peptidase C39 family protein [Gilvimarinus sp. SDUM040013]|uniref:GNAT family N-acetyltransferase/peptidase C39 family protein n=1 Tax=Gilvimarinus gilvus TaxID=3058038 RepID=A0ABU4S1F3_9GAMM|nr:GNAT family N-acetyltransferase/peptidase C39 family protein [Gilvimarinus sp. SDUM040013]MDO3388070.1 GNAT family N-acetyltransferase/peptidase C39 family protein [Gilvimarinus sp. SDUM040013]MDX6850978.1 GNAT family N-acetyltransferase/peptidase C39 family protein [Gilvimarinus sp. SDUM040013]